MSQVIDAGIEGNSRVFFIKGGRTAIVDTGGPGNERNILRALKSAGIPREQVSVIIVTHAHIDHCGSAHALKGALKVPVLAGWPDADYLEKGENLPVMNDPGKNDLPRAPGPKFEGVKADVIVKEDMGLDGYGIDALVLKTPGHTDGSISVLASNGDCVTGDFLASLYSGKPEVIQKSLKKLADHGAKRFYPSHAARVEAAAVLNIFFSA
jgi:hydroxyacylglutathione hydrolase